jgi:transposase
MGTADPQPSMFYHINLEQYVTADHPMRKIRPLIDTARIRQLCEPLYAETGRPSIPPEQLFLALLGGYLLGVTSERALVRELTGNLVLRWFVGLDLDQQPWDHSTFSQNRKRRFTESGLLERLFDETVALAIKHKLVSQHTTLDGTLVQANASHKSFVPMEVFLKPEAYKQRIRSGRWMRARRRIRPRIRGIPRSRFAGSGARIRPMSRRPIRMRNWRTRGMGRPRWSAIPSMG